MGLTMKRRNFIKKMLVSVSFLLLNLPIVKTYLKGKKIKYKEAYYYKKY